MMLGMKGLFLKYLQRILRGKLNITMLSFINDNWSKSNEYNMDCVVECICPIQMRAT